MRKKICCLILCLYPIVSYGKEQKNTSTVDPQLTVKNFCAEYDSQKDFFKRMAKEILSDEKTRAEFAKGLSQKNFQAVNLL